MRISAEASVTPPDTSPDGAPAVGQRSPLAVWLFAQRMDLRAAAALFGCSHTAVANFSRDFDDPLRVVPKPKMIEVIWEATRGAIIAGDHYPPRLSDRNGPRAEAVNQP